MQVDRYLAKRRIIDLRSKTLSGALEELLQVSTKNLSENLNNKDLLETLIAREKTMTTYLGHGVSMPHMRIAMKRPYIFAIGRSREGILYEGSAEEQEIHLIFLLLASERQRDYLNELSSLARMFREKEFVDSIVKAPGLKGLRESISLGFRGLLAKPERKQNRFNRIVLREAEKMAKASRCAAILIFSDTFAGGIEVTESFPNYRTIIVSRAAPDLSNGARQVEASIEVRTFSSQRLAQARSAILIGLTRGIFKFSDRLLCVGGIPASNQLDTVVIMEVEREFQSVLAREENLLPTTVEVEVVERILAIATELAVEGREGHPVGCLFVLGDYEKVSTMVKPLVLNPFHGYREEDRNVLNPFMDETIKEFSVIDGCFVIRGDGVIESAGSLIHAPAEFYGEKLPGGLGARHTAAAAISRAAECISIVVSASTGQVTIFRRGVMLPLLEKPIGDG